MHVNVYSSLLGGWARLTPPTPEHPYWHDADDGTPYDLRTAVGDGWPDTVIAVHHAHVTAVANLLSRAMAMDPIRDFAERRRLAHAASLLAGEVGGLPTSPFQTRPRTRATPTPERN
ncbi:hypothetical protein Q5424_01160 [Conexibacter sp. JD483]|uniref:hypothetical protein n=1 Tax=unclassified Conexibacter TaxID=2627773 RepID=UPI0027188630|nr:MULTISPECIES: hypothetical protein [unclassified Conexibacter]MDO8185837.1 hypothetical protein [Conexibacter sp. CPCC 205706]MDO8198581.1 hypothetical protein [Conexibacter sp. CPCC 205762]MDR9367667.1 hypothetical protein [Conexibacter sp. JD483]